MGRTWTQEQLAPWKAERDAKRESQGLCPFDELDGDKKKVALKAQKSELLKSTQLQLKSKAWQLGRFPMAVSYAPSSGHLECPRNYLSSAGHDRVKFYEGDNLNLLTFQHYDEDVDAATYSGNNYVSGGAEFHGKRNEYMGPSPKVLGFRIKRGKAEIIFWDDFLETDWIGKSQWSVDLEFDDVVESWFVVENS